MTTIKYAIFSLEDALSNYTRILGITDINNFNSQQEAMNWMIENPKELREGVQFTILPVITILNEKLSINLE